MTDNEIIKALEFCKNIFCNSDCPLSEDFNCMGTLSRNALDLIKRQQERFDRIVEQLEEASCYIEDGDGHAGHVMSRLTYRNSTGRAFINHTYFNWEDCVAYKLAHYEDLEEDGRLIELSCKVGDTVYFPLKNKHNSAIIDCIQIEKYGVFVYWKQYETGVDVTELWDEGSFEISAIGKTVFLTKAEAEAKLAELKGE